MAASTVAAGAAALAWGAEEALIVLAMEVRGRERR